MTNPDFAAALLISKEVGALCSAAHKTKDEDERRDLHDRALALLNGFENFDNDGILLFQAARIYQYRGFKEHAFYLVDKGLSVKPNDFFSLILRGDLHLEFGRVDLAARDYITASAHARDVGEKRKIVDFLTLHGFTAEAEKITATLPAPKVKSPAVHVPKPKPPKSPDDILNDFIQNGNLPAARILAEEEFLLSPNSKTFKHLKKVINLERANAPLMAHKHISEPIDDLDDDYMFEEDEVPKKSEILHARIAAVFRNASETTDPITQRPLEDDALRYMHSSDDYHNDAELLTHAAKIYYRRCQYIAALRHLDRAVFVSPNYAPARMLRGEMRANVDRIAKATEDYVVAARHPMPDRLKNLIRILHFFEKHDLAEEAQEVNDQLLTMKLKKPFDAQLLMDVYLQSGDVAAAKTVAENFALTGHPESAIKLMTHILKTERAQVQQLAASAPAGIPAPAPSPGI